MKLLLLSALAVLALSSCVDDPAGTSGTATVLDTNWIGEVRMTKGDTVIRLCGTGRTYHLSGPDMDTLAYRYTHARMNTGQWMKVWCYGHIGAIRRGDLIDSALLAVKFQHLDASLKCDPIPDLRVSGDWKLDDPDPKYPRDIHLHLYPDGSALMITDLRNGRPALEEDGSWGVDVESTVNVTWPQRQQTMLYHWDGSTLSGSSAAPGRAIILRRIGDADRLAGAFGRTARWLAATATAQGRPTNAEDLRPTTPLAELFPSESARSILRTQAMDTLALDTESAALRLDAATTVRDYMLLMRYLQRR